LLERDNVLNHFNRENVVTLNDVKLLLERFIILNPVRSLNIHGGGWKGSPTSRGERVIHV
jgi:hypothetical protein